MLSGLIFETLGPLVNDRCYPNTFPQIDWDNPARAVPAIRYQFVSDDVAGDICGSHTDELDDARVQIDVVALTYGAMKVLKRNVQFALQGMDPPCMRQPGGFEVYDEETKTHRAIMDYVFFPSSGNTGSP